jgi:c-di-GMP-binding flagellar brake protein YcgR
MDLHLMRFGESLNVLIAIARESNLKLILAASRKRINRRATASAERKIGVIFLSEIRGSTMVSPPAEVERADREPADLCAADR